MSKLAALALLLFPLLSIAGTHIRLPSMVRPLDYQIDLSLDPAKPTHRGMVQINLQLLQATRQLELHAKGLEIQSALLSQKRGKQLAKVQRIDADIIRLILPRTQPQGQATLKLTFSGKLSDKEVSGIFRQREGNDWYAFTQFEATGARKAFPSFDQPEYKVPFSLSLTVPRELTAVANTPQTDSTDLGNGQKRVSFATSKPLPSYLLAFGVGPFDILDGGKAGQTQLRYLTPRGRAQEASFAASVTPKIVAALEQYFGMPYPYEKLDSMAIPITVGFSAMENAGLITYGSGIIAAKPGHESEEFKRRYVAIAAHELAHQWFGNYVTMAWWDDLWLNESFASWMGEKITSQVMPAWNWDVSQQYARANAMEADRLANARRIHQPVNNRDDLSGAFDRITYQKGHSVLGMFEQYLGPAKFQAGVHRYMAKHGWGNAKGGDFIAALSDGDAEVARAFRSFIEQPGIPRLNIAVDCQDGVKLSYSQSRFLPLGSQANHDAQWLIPVRLRTPAGESSYLLNTQQGELKLPDQSCPAWLEANAGGHGYYRPVYRPEALQALLSQGQASVHEVLAQLDDVSALSESGDLTIAQALKLAARHASHPRREVVEWAASIFKRGEALLDDDLAVDYAQLWQAHFGLRARQLGWQHKATDDADTRLLRAELVAAVADYGQDSALQDEAKRMAWDFLNGKLDIAEDLRAGILQTAALTGDRPLFEAMLTRVKSSQDRRERKQLFAAIGMFRQAELAQAARQLLLEPELDIREMQDPILDRHNRLPALRAGSLRFIQRYYGQLAKRLGPDGPTRFPRYLSEANRTAEQVLISQFFTPLASRYEGGQTALKQNLESIALNIRYRDQQAASLREYLKTRQLGMRQ